MRIAAELADSIFKVVLDFTGKPCLCECGSAEHELSDGGGVRLHLVTANVLDDDGYMHRTTIRRRTSEEFAQADVAAINYPVSLVERL